ncbi:hypothetical protein [Novilysobacter spongiicola]|uniref:DUF7738 domain-containing protein n=1 Tax=Lysobacter spongiicola DSM 21749 TaxID=1122188 RepID=A0A1T4NSJ3_9GAMM|nr:hypothetical protein [Lysobacter spongiicola]SJZ81668.1 hypothetical protein SAMN02745674_00867 [Lysobacter spongiicola DSM 21749]
MESLVKQLLAIVSLLCVLAGCDFAQSQWIQAKEGIGNALNEPRQIPRGAEPEITVEGARITFDGKFLTLGDDFTEWVEVLGEDYRPAVPGYEYETTFVWDNIGVIVEWDSTDNRIVEHVGIRLNFNSLYEEWEPGYDNHRPGAGSVPANMFRGYLEVNGVAVDHNSTVFEVNRRADGRLSISCSRGINVCSDRVTPAGVPRPWFDVDSRKEAGVIYGIGFSLPDQIK